MPGALQAFQQGFAVQQVEAAIRGGDKTHSSNPRKSSADTWESICPTRYELNSTSCGATCTVSEASHVLIQGMGLFLAFSNAGLRPTAAIRILVMYSTYWPRMSLFKPIMEPSRKR